MPYINKIHPQYTANKHVGNGSVWDSILKYTTPQAKFSECGCVIASTCHVYSNFAIWALASIQSAG